MQVLGNFILHFFEFFVWTLWYVFKFSEVVHHNMFYNMLLVRYKLYPTLYGHMSEIIFRLLNIMEGLIEQDILENHARLKFAKFQKSHSMENPFVWACLRFLKYHFIFTSASRRSYESTLWFVMLIMVPYRNFYFWFSIRQKRVVGLCWRTVVWSSDGAVRKAPGASLYN